MNGKDGKIIKLPMELSPQDKLIVAGEAKFVEKMKEHGYTMHMPREEGHVYMVTTSEGEIIFTGDGEEALQWSADFMYPPKKEEEKDV